MNQAKSNANQEIQNVMHTVGTASLGTLSDDAAPFVSLVTVARTNSQTMVMLLSGLAAHTQNLRRDGRASLLLVAFPASSSPTTDPMAGARVTLMGSVTQLAREEDESIRATFLQRHPSASMYADFGDFGFFSFQIERAHLVAGFGKIQTIMASDLAETNLESDSP